MSSIDTSSVDTYIGGSHNSHVFGSATYKYKS